MGKFTQTVIKNVAMIAVGGVIATLAKRQVDRFVYADGDKYICGPAEIKTEVKHVDVTWLAGDVRVKTWDYNTVAFVEEGDGELSQKDSLYYLINGNRLYIKFCKSGDIINRKAKVLTLCIPNDLVLDDIKIDTASANVEIFDTVIDDVNVTTTSGNVMADIPSSDSVVVKTTSGRVEINVSSLGSMEIKTTSGNVGAYSDVLPSVLDIKTNSGEVTVKLPAYAKFNPSVSTTSGSVYSEYRYEESEEKVSVKTTSGNINFIMK